MITSSKLWQQCNKLKVLVDKAKQNKSNLDGGVMGLGPMTLTLWNEIVFPNQYTELCVHPCQFCLPEHWRDADLTVVTVENVVSLWNGKHFSDAMVSCRGGGMDIDWPSVVYSVCVFVQLSVTSAVSDTADLISYGPKMISMDSWWVGVGSYSRTKQGDTAYWLAEGAAGFFEDIILYCHCYHFEGPYQCFEMSI